MDLYDTDGWHNDDSAEDICRGGGWADDERVAKAIGWFAGGALAALILFSMFHN
jgi:hypothetical protein